MNSADFAQFAEPVARAVLGEPNKALSSKGELRFGSRGSWALDRKQGVFFSHEFKKGGGVLWLLEHEKGLAGHEAFDFMRDKLGLPIEEPNTTGKGYSLGQIVAEYNYADEAGELIFQVVRFSPKDFRQRRPDGGAGGWSWSVKGVRQVPYRLPELIEAIGNDHTVFIVEGERDCDNLARLNIPATCNAGGAGKWKPELSEHFRDARVIVIPDNDLAGRRHADLVCVALKGQAQDVRLLELPDLPSKGDVSDWLAMGGTVEQLYELAANAPAWTGPIADNIARLDGTPALGAIIDDAVGNGAAANRFTLEMLDEIAVADDPVELVQGLLPMGPALGVVFGPPKSLKSFLLMHLGLHIADSRPYCGRAVQGGAVVYVTPEGIRGVRRRLIAARRAMDLEGQRRPFALVSTMPNLGTGSADRDALERMISEALNTMGVPLRLIVIDTLRRAMPGKSENEQKDVSIVVENCEALARAFGCLVILVHHSPRSDDQRGSGSNAVDGAADLMWSVIRPTEARPSAVATVVRYKDGEEGDTWTFELRPAEIGIDRNGNSITSCSVEVVLEPARKVAAAQPKPLSAAQQRIFDILLTASIEAGVEGEAGDAAPRTARAVTRDTLKAYAKKAGWWDDDHDKSSRSRFAARLNELAGKRAIGLTATHVWSATRVP